MTSGRNMNHQDDLNTRVEREICELHAFFQVWFRGGPEDDDGFARFADALAESFVIIAPSGEAFSRTMTLEMVRAGRAGDPDCRIWIQHVEIRHAGEETVLATYQEWQERGGVTRGRLSSVLFRVDSNAANGLRWLHVHETWLPDSV